MVPWLTRGVPFHGEFSSADAHSPGSESAARFSLYGAGQTSTITLTSNDYVIVTDALVSGTTTAIVVQLFDGAAASPSAGNLIAKFNVPVSGVSVTWSRQSGHWCVQGTYPKLLTNVAGQVDCIIAGYIYSHPGV